MTPPPPPVVADPTTATLARRTVRSSRQAATRDLASRHLHGVSTLLQVRTDLRGVHAFADVVEESVRWSA